MCNTYLSACSIYKMLPTCRLADNRYKIYSAHLARLSKTQCAACDPRNTLNEEASRASAWRVNRRAPTHQEHNICLLVKCSCHADTLALPPRQINTLEISRRETISQWKKRPTEYSYLYSDRIIHRRLFWAEKHKQMFPKCGPAMYPCGVLGGILGGLLFACDSASTC